MHRYWNDGWNGGWWWMAITMVAFWGGIIWIALTVIRHTTHTPHLQGPGQHRRRRRRALLERLAGNCEHRLDCRAFPGRGRCGERHFVDHREGGDDDCARSKLGGAENLRGFARELVDQLRDSCAHVGASLSMWPRGPARRVGR